MKVFKFIPLVLALAIVTGSCKRTSEKILGPKKVEARSDFAILSKAHYLYDKKAGTKSPVTTSIFIATPNAFDKGYFLSATFTQEVTWFLTITHKITGAEYKLSGTSAQMDSSSMHWIGQNTNFKVFNHTTLADSVYVKLEFLGSDYTYMDTLRFRAPTAGPGALAGYYTNVGRKLIIVDNFDGVSQYITNIETTDSRLKQEFADALDAPVILENSLTYCVDGIKSFHMKGKDSNKNSYIGGINTFSLVSLAERTIPESKVNVTDPADLYVNFYLYGVLSQTALQVKLYEIDDYANFPSANPSYLYGDNQDSNDGWIYDMTVNWTGWKLISIPYRDFKRANDPVYGGNGNGIKEPNKITGMAITLTSQDAYPSGELYLDMVSLTTYGPFTQTP
jgi:hypothetical protein